MKLSVISKVYVWSVLLESFLYFILAHQSVTIVGLSVSRVLQIIVIFCLFSKINNNHLLNIINPFSFFNYKFSLYFLYMIIVSIFGYTLYEFNLDAAFTGDAMKRELFEFIVQLYYFIYFAVLPRFFIRSKKGVEYFFKVFFITFFITVFFGIADLFSVYFFDSNLISRQMYEDVGVGFRFHGFSGEPRDAYVYLVLSVSLFVMYSIWKQEKLSIILLVFIASLILLTQSMSFIVGVLILTVLLPLYYAKHNTMKSNIIFLFLYFIAAFFLAVALSYSYRIGLYFDALQQLYFNLSQGLLNSFGALEGQMVNIIPIWDIWLKLSDYNPIPLLFGHGFGSSAVVNSAYLQEIYLDPEYSVLNPHAQIIRTIFDGGIVGTLLFISLFLSPFKKNLIRIKDYKKFIIAMLLVLSAFFSHRMVAPYILFGIASVIFPLIKNEFMNTVNHSKVFDQK